jgi:hypothetical protein
MKPALEWFGRSLLDLAQGRHGHKDDFTKHRHACCGGCEVPETCCPPRCVGEIRWKIQRGAVPEASVLVRNVGSAARTFAFSATPLGGVDPGSARLTLTPASAPLLPGESTLVRVRLEDSLALRACQDYSAELLVRGAWEQCVKVHVHVAADPFDKVAVEQGDSLKHRALHPHTYKAAITWKLDRGAVPEGAITVHNTGAQVQSFSFEANPLIGPAAPGARVVVLPDSIQLSPGQSGVARLRLQASAALAPGQTYQSEILVHGFYEQAVGVKADVEPDASAYTEVEQGDAPTHRRAHHWYDHFQCTESCSSHSL